MRLFSLEGDECGGVCTDDDVRVDSNARINGMKHGFDEEDASNYVDIQGCRFQLVVIQNTERAIALD